MSGPIYTPAQLKAMEAERIRKETQKRLEEERARLEEKKAQEKAAEEERRRIELMAAVDEFNNQLKALDEIGNRIVMLQAKVMEDLKNTNQEAADIILLAIDSLLQKVNSYPRKILGNAEIFRERAGEIREDICLYNEELNDIHRSLKQLDIILQGDTIENASLEDEKPNVNIILNPALDLSHIENTFNRYSDIYDISQTDKYEIKAIRNNVMHLYERVCMGQLEKYNELEREVNTLEDKADKAKRNYEMYVAAYDEYYIRAKLYGEEPVSIEYFRDVIEIEDEIAELEKALEEKEKLEYISSSIDEVMKEFGHHIVGSNVFKSGTQLHRKKYYTFHKQSVVTITQNETGSILMETGVVSDDVCISEAEKKQAINNMHLLCEQFPEIVKRLEEKGIVVNQKIHLPAEEKYISRVSQADAYSKKEAEVVSGKTKREKRLENIERKRKKSSQVMHITE